jgi:hypothetical protein
MVGVGEEQEVASKQPTARRRREKRFMLKKERIVINKLGRLC